MYTNGTEQLSHRALQNHLGVSFPRGKPPAGWKVVDNSPPEPTLDDLKRRQRGQINNAYRESLRDILDDYPDVERESWGKQEAEARAMLADDTATTPYLDTLAAERETTREDMAQRIVKKADAWAQLSASATGKRHRLMAQVEAAESADDLDSIEW